MTLQQRFIFLAASYPPRDYAATSDSHEIARAIKILAGTVFQEDGCLAFGGHPSISPLILMIAREYQQKNRIRIYQTELYRDQISPATIALQEEGYGELVFTPAKAGEEPTHGRNTQSLTLMRERMVKESNPMAAIFIGGDSGVGLELELFRRSYPQRLAIPIGGPGGIARELVDQMQAQLEPTNLLEELRSSRNYLSLMRKIVLAIERSPAEG